mmetsp:Transcript_30022/g.68334  ORF Transcript_30022/g.68334 Transcript_30022/m.68334 type:complete len:140 (-) Transcript_30022:196-615(-)
MEHAFSFCNAAVMPGWICLAAAPTWRHTRKLVFGGVCVNAVFYVVMFATTKFEMSVASLSSLQGIRELFQGADAPLHMAAWLHYLAFDLLVGLLEAEDGVKNGVPRAVVAPCLGLTLMAGPVGALSYGIARQLFASKIK